MSEQPGVVTFLCRSCTRLQQIQGVDNRDAIKHALSLGWVPDGDQMICPSCPAARVKIRERAA